MHAEGTEDDFFVLEANVKRFRALLKAEDAGPNRNTLQHLLEEFERKLSELRATAPEG